MALPAVSLPKANCGVVKVNVPPPAKPCALIAEGSISTRALI
ncbi:MAG: hypothetical protein WDN03_16255 [Rhizomicrobium sp.]